jgi:hypothetical protein
MAVNRHGFDDLIGMVDGNDYQTLRAVAGALTLLPRDIAERLAAECFFLRFEADGTYLPASVQEGRSIIGFASDFLVKYKSNPSMQTQVILRECAHHMLGHHKGWEHRDPGEDMEADMLVHTWLANWATP